MDYEVTVDFHDNSVSEPQTFRSLSDLGLYLERIPAMVGFEIHREATVHIRTKYSRAKQTPLPFERDRTIQIIANQLPV